MMNHRSMAEKIFLAGVDRVLPDRLISKSMTIRDNCLFINDLILDPDSFEHIYLIGAGKASALMGAEVENILGDNISEGHIVVKYGHACDLKRIKVTEAGHPVPDPNGFAATFQILDICIRAGSNDLVICLLSGGGSALLPDCPEGVGPDEMMKLTCHLVNSGASITEINTVRKHLSNVKGGQLARAVYPGTMVTLILSDVVGDPLDVIASGPTVPDPTTFLEALDILDKYSITKSVPGEIVSYLEEGASGKRAETPKPDDPLFGKTFNILIGNNKLALEAARQKAAELNISAVIINDRIEGDISAASEYIIGTALKFQRDDNVSKPVCLLFGGEPTVKVSGNGSGGRNQHLALSCAVLLRDHEGITVLSAGTDGTDGLTSAAGAVADCNSYKHAMSLDIFPEKYLMDFDSFNFFRKAGGHIITGPTMTNVMDIIVVIVE
jgi:glycerate 2-kinase